MPVETTDLGAAVCRALMRALDDKPIALEKPRLGTLSADYEATSAGGRTIVWQWCVVLLPTLDFVSVRANLKCWGMGLYDLAVLNPEGGQFDKYIFVKYPADRSQITGPEYEGELRTAVDKAVAAVEEDWERVRAAHVAKTGEGSR